MKHFFLPLDFRWCTLQPGVIFCFPFQGTENSCTVMFQLRRFYLGVRLPQRSLLYISKNNEMPRADIKKRQREHNNWVSAAQRLRESDFINVFSEECSNNEAVWLLLLAITLKATTVWHAPSGGNFKPLELMTEIFNLYAFVYKLRKGEVRGQAQKKLRRNGEFIWSHLSGGRKKPH